MTTDPTSNAPDPLDDVRATAARWRVALQARSQGHRSSDALTELAWADHALADIERAAGAVTTEAPEPQAEQEQDSLFEVTT